MQNDVFNPVADTVNRQSELLLKEQNCFTVIDESIPSPKEIQTEDTIVLPEIVSMTDYIHRHYEGEIIAACMNQIYGLQLCVMYEGKLFHDVPGLGPIDYGEEELILTDELSPGEWGEPCEFEHQPRVYAADVRPVDGSITWMSFRRIADGCIEADLTIEMEFYFRYGGHGRFKQITQKYYTTLWMDMDDSPNVEFGDFSLRRHLKNDSGVKLDEYLVPVYKWDDIEEESENIIFHTLTTIRKLKEHGVEVYFEEQNIYTLDGKGEVLLTIMSSIAQEESRNISENVTWGMRKRFAEGKVAMAYKQFMGYRRGKNGIPEVVEAEAKIIRTIFRRFLEGTTPAIIARELNLAGIPCPSRKSLLGENEIEAAKARKKTARWSPSTIESILTNEKYKGDAILQKTYCTDYIKKTFVVNDGSEIPKYYAQNSHPAIVSAEVFDLTQMELEWRRSLKGSYSGKSCFSSRIVCGDCGAFYGSKVWHSTDEYRRTIWRCNNKYEGDKKCSTPHVTQEELEKAFVDVMQKVIAEKDVIFAVCREVLDEALDTSELDRIATRLQDQALGMAERVRKLVEENARVRRDQEEYQQEYDALAAEHEKLSEKIRSVEEQKKDKTDRRRKIEIFLRMFEEQKECVVFDPYAFVALIDKVTVGQDRTLEFIFRNGMKYRY